MEEAYASKDFLLETQRFSEPDYDCHFDRVKINYVVDRPVVDINRLSVSNGALRLTTIFLRLLDAQFPINLVKKKIVYRYPGEFAGALCVHINHLNRCLKNTTGKTTSQHIVERIVQEARSLLNYTEWNICEIGYCLLFEEASHFINFFKKNMKMSPTAYRKMERLKELNK